MSAQLNLNLRNVSATFNKLQPNPKAPARDRFSVTQSRFKKSRDITQLGEVRATSNYEFKASAADETVVYFRPSLWGIPGALGGRIIIQLDGTRTLTEEQEEMIQKALVPKSRLDNDELEALMDEHIAETYPDDVVTLMRSSILSFMKVNKGEVKALGNLTLGTDEDDAADAGTVATSAARSNDVKDANIEELQSIIAVTRDRDAQAHESAQTLLALKLYSKNPKVGMSYHPLAGVVNDLHTKASLGDLSSDVAAVSRDLLDDILDGRRCSLRIQVGMPHRVTSDALNPSGLVQKRETEDGEEWISGADNVASKEKVNNSFSGRFSFDDGTAEGVPDLEPEEEEEEDEQSEFDELRWAAVENASIAKMEEDKGEALTNEQVESFRARFRAKVKADARRKRGATKEATRAVGFADDDDDGGPTVRGGILRSGRARTPGTGANGELPFDALGPETSDLEVIESADWIGSVVDGKYNSGNFNLLDDTFNWNDLDMSMFEKETIAALLEFALGAANTIGLDIDSASPDILARFVVIRGYALRHQLCNGRKSEEFSPRVASNEGALPIECEKECFDQLVSGLMGPVGLMTCLHGFKKSGHYVTANALANTACRLYLAVKSESDDAMDFDPNTWSEFLGSALYPGCHFVDLRIVEIHFRFLMQNSNLSFAFGRRIFPNGPGNVGPFLLCKVLLALKEAKFFELMNKEKMFEAFIGSYKSWERDCWKELPYSKFFYGESRAESTGFKNFIASYGHYAHALDSIMPASTFQFSVALKKASADSAANSIVANLEVKAFVAAYRAYVARLVSGKLQRDATKAGGNMITV